MWILSLGIEYTRFVPFEALTPVLLGGAEQPTLLVDDDYAPTREEYDYCYQFVVTMALRVAEVGSNATEPSWIRARVDDTEVKSALVSPPGCEGAAYLPQPPHMLCRAG
jgi:hypothetical protein